MKYTIFSIEPSRWHYVDRIRASIPSWNEVETDVVDGRITYELDRAQEAHPYEINYPALTGQLGIWYTVLNAMEHAPVVTFEDDAILGPNFTINWTMRYRRLPKDTDFFSLFLPRDQDHVFSESMSANRLITRTYQRYGGVSMYYTKSGVEKIKSLLKRDGITDQYDNTLYRYAKAGELNGYCSKPTYPDLVYITGEEKSIVQESEPWKRF